MTNEGYVACMGKWNMHSFCLGNQNGKTICKTQALRVGNIKIDLQETGWQAWIGLIWLRTGTCGRLLQTWWNFRLDKMCKSLLVSLGTITFSRRTLLHTVKQSVSWLPIIRYLVSFPCIYWRSLALVHTTLTMLSSIRQNCKIFLQVSVPQFWNSDCKELLNPQQM